MASELLLAPDLYRCYYCQFESTDNAFKYFDNKKVDQPRHQCLQCHKLFTLGLHGRPQGRTYAKKRYEDPAELKNLSRQCPHCGVADNAPFKYYNNNSRLQPRFQCRSCKEKFQMRLMGTGNEMRLAHTSSKQRGVNTGRCKKPRKPSACTNASISSGEESYQLSDGSFMPSDLEVPSEPNTRFLPESCDEKDLQFASLLETELLTEENNSPNADSISGCDANVDTGLLPELSAEEAQLLGLLELEPVTNEDEPVRNENNGLPLGLNGPEYAEFLAFLEAGFLTDGKEAPWNVDSFSSIASADDGLLPWSDNDADLMDFDPMAQIGVKAHELDDAEMVAENMVSMDSDGEVDSCTLLSETLTSLESDSWINDPIEDSSSLNYSDDAVACRKCMDVPCPMSEAPVPPKECIEDSSSVNYLEAAVACCELMDMPNSVPVAPAQLVGSSSSSAGSTISFGDASCMTSKPISCQQDLMEEDQCSTVRDWNEWQDEELDALEMAVLI